RHLVPLLIIKYLLFQTPDTTLHYQILTLLDTWYHFSLSNTYSSRHLIPLLIIKYF
ncbi:hypothetical protein LOTGIDRAFT_57848, partial [Lottia gigantea]